MRPHLLLAGALALAACEGAGGPSLPSREQRCGVYATALAVLEAARADHNPAQAQRLAAYRALLASECDQPPPPAVVAPVPQAPDGG